MKGRNLSILLAAAVVMGLAAYYASRQEQKAVPAVQAKNLFADLPVNDVEKIILYSMGNTVTVAKVGDVWAVPGLYDYPANFDKIRTALRKVVELKSQQALRVSPKQMQDLSLTSPLDPAPAGTNKTGVLVKLVGAKDQALASLLLGKYHERKAPEGPMAMYGGYPDGRYVSVGKGDVYLVADALDDFSGEARAWLATELLNVPQQDVNEVRITGTGRAPVRLVRSEAGGDLKIEGLADTEEAEAYKVNAAGGALSYLNFADVAAPTVTAAQAGLDKPVVYNAKAKDGRIYTVGLGTTNDAGRRYAKFSVAYAPPPEPAAAAPEQKEGAEKDAPDKAKQKQMERAKLEQETRATNEKLQKWTYLIETYKTDPMTYTRNDLVKKKETKAEAGTNAAPAAASEAQPAGSASPTFKAAQ